MGALELLGEKPGAPPKKPAPTGGALGELDQAPAAAPAMTGPEALLQAATTVTPFGVVSPSQVLGTLPQAGMTVGGALGGPGGAAVGGGAMEAARQGLTSAMTLGGGGGFDPKAVDQAAAMGAVTQAGGDLLGAGMKAAAKGLARLSAKTSPEVAQVMLDEGITATTQGLKKVRQRIGQVGGELHTAVGSLARRGAKIDKWHMANDVLKEFDDLFQGGQAIVTPHARKLLHLTQQFLRDHPGGKIGPKVLHQIKQTSDEYASGIRETLSKGGHVPFAKQLEARWHKAMADWARSRLHTDPAIAAADAHLTKLIELKDAVWPAVAKARPFAERVAVPVITRGGGAAIGGAIGSTVPGHREANILGGALVGAGISSPAVLSTTALTLQASSPIMRALFTAAPRVSTRTQDRKP